MKKQIFYIHGGSSYSNYADFLNNLETKPLRSPSNEKNIDLWPSTLREKLGGEYEVFMPTMPNSQNAKYKEWKIWFERHFEYLNDDVILAGWSLGGYFLAKYLIENEMPVKIQALFLVAAPYMSEDFDDGEDCADFAFDTSRVGELEKRTDHIYMMHSKDDFCVNYKHALLYEEKLAQAELITFDDKNHFIVEELPELIDRIISIS